MARANSTRGSKSAPRIEEGEGGHHGLGLESEPQLGAAGAERVDLGLEHRNGLACPARILECDRQHGRDRRLADRIGGEP